MTLAPIEHVGLGHRSGRAVAWTGAEALISGVLREETLHDWAAANPERGTFAGRGEVFTIPAPVPGPDARVRWAVRHYWRGGAMSHLRDRYLRLGRPRPFREARASRLARERGIRTPAVIAGATYVDGGWYRGDLVTEVVPDVETLATALHRHDGTRAWLVAMERAGSLVRRLAYAGVWHVDLNAHNVLLADDPDTGIWVVDLDRARVARGPWERARGRMLDRLTRSVIKIGTPTGERLTHAEIERALTRSPRS